MSKTVRVIVVVSVLLNVVTVFRIPGGLSSPEKSVPVCIGRATVRFSPSGGVETHLIKMIDEARQTIYMLAYSFTSEPIAKALIKAHARGVYIEVILDAKSIHNRQNKAKLLESAGINVWIDSSHPIAHNKTILIDDRLICTGSYNFSNAAELNAENSLTLDCPDLFARYMADYREHREHSKELAEMVFTEIRRPDEAELEEF